MKKNLFFNVSKTIAGALMFSLAFTACQKDFKREEEGEELAIKASRASNSLSAVPLSVTIETFEGAKITPDGAGTYVHGTAQNVRAELDVNGSFMFSTQLFSDQPVQRSWNYDFSTPVIDTTSYRTSVVPAKVMNLFSVGANSKCGTLIPIQSMGVGSSQLLGLGGGFTGSNNQVHRISFHRSAEEVETSPTAYAKVHRVSQDVWEITPVGICFPSQQLNVASLRSGAGTRKDPTVLHGYYNMPFKFTLTRLTTL